MHGCASPNNSPTPRRQDKLERKQQRRQEREAVAAAEGREPEPPTPPPSSLVAGGAHTMITPAPAAEELLTADPIDSAPSPSEKRFTTLELPTPCVQDCSGSQGPHVAPPRRCRLSGS